MRSWVRRFTWSKLTCPKVEDLSTDNQPHGQSVLIRDAIQPASERHLREGRGNEDGT